MPRFCANISMMFVERPLRERFAAASRAGFAGVELQFPYDLPAEDTAHLARLAGVEIVNFNTPVGDRAAGEVGIACLPRREGDFRQHVVLARRYAEIVGCRRINVLSGILPPGVERERALNVLYDNLYHAATEMARAGIVLMIEPINGRDRPGFLLNTVEDAVAVAVRVGHPNLKVEADVYHMAVMGEDIVAVIGAHARDIAHMQFADFPGRKEPGTGRLDFRAIFAAIDASGYDGWVSAEYDPSGPTEETLGWYAPYRHAAA